MSRDSKENVVTNISADYLRLITDTFEQSLAAGQPVSIEWTELLQQEHQAVLRKIGREEADLNYTRTHNMNTVGSHKTHATVHPTLQSNNRRSRTHSPPGKEYKDRPHGVGDLDTSQNRDNLEDRPDEIAWGLLIEDDDPPTTPRSSLDSYECRTTERVERQVDPNVTYTTPIHTPSKSFLGAAISPDSASTDKQAGDIILIRPNSMDKGLQDTGRIDTVLTSITELLRMYPDFTHLRNDEAQPLIDGLQAILDHFNLEDNSRHIIFTTLRKISRRSNIYPSNLSLVDVKLEGQQPLAQGSFGDIYKAQLRDQPVCLKVVRINKLSEAPRLNKAFYREAIIWRQLSHINVLPFYGIYHIDDSRIALVSPWIVHGSVNHFLKDYPDADRPLLVSDVAQGLSYLHSSHIIHGDLKGGNILVTDSHRACLADFGLSLVTDRQGSRSSSSVNPEGGSLRWLAPELMELEGPSPKSQASDVYAFSLACYEIFTGDKPFPEVTHDFVVMLKVTRGERPKRPSHPFKLDDKIWQLIEECWQHEPEKRPSASDIAKRFAMWTDSGGDQSRGGDDSPQSSPSIGSNPRRTRQNISIDGRLQILEGILAHILLQQKAGGTMPTKSGEQLNGIGWVGVADDEISPKEPTPSGSSQRTSITKDISLEAAKDGPPAVIARLLHVFGDVEQYRKILSYPRTEAQSQGLLDLFQMLLGDPHLGPHLRHNLIIATQRLAKATDLYPKCFSLKEDTTVVDDYPVAAGSFADVHRGRLQGQLVCLKVIRLYQSSRVDYVLKRFYQEAILWGQLSHPNLLPFYGLYRFRSRLCLVSPWAENGDITNYLQENPSANRILLALDIALGILDLHNKDIVHGDIKGSNILVASSGRACLADFGLSAVTDPKILNWTSQSSATSKGGSIRWQAPELFGAENDEIVPNSKESDIYAWSCVCYEIFTGDVPFFEFGRDSTVMLKVGLGKRPSCPTLSSPSWVKWGLTRAIWSLMEDCWKTDPAGRPTAHEVTTRLSLCIPAGSDQRPETNWGDFVPSELQNAVGSDIQYPSIHNLETMLWGTATDVN